jgi:hypothetical protein
VEDITLEAIFEVGAIETHVLVSGVALKRAPVVLELLDLIIHAPHVLVYFGRA